MFDEASQITQLFKYRHQVRASILENLFYNAEKFLEELNHFIEFLRQAPKISVKDLPTPFDFWLGACSLQDLQIYSPVSGSFKSETGAAGATAFQVD